LPYAVLDFDKVQTFVGSEGGTIQNPIWKKEKPIFWTPLSESDTKARLMKSGSWCGYEFDVSRVAELRVDFYLRSPNAPRGSQDIFLGMIKMNPFLEENEPTGGRWFKIQDGTGMVRIEVEYSKNKPAALRDWGYLGPAADLKRKNWEVYDVMNIKVADLDPLSEAATELRFLVDNPFIVPLKFAIETSDQISLYCPKLKGGQLLYHLQRVKHFDIHRSKLYAAEILCAVEYLHTLNIIPCWLKPENIFLDALGHVLLSDFGLFNLPIRNEDHILKKKSEYPAPELLLGHSCSLTADWWTLGVFLYEMLTGLPPFYDEDSQEVHRKILHEVVHFPETLAPDARDILSKLLNRDPDQRLGAGGASEIKTHVFFHAIDWNMVYEKRTKPDYTPTDLILSKIYWHDALLSPRSSGLTFPRRTYNVELSVNEIYKIEESNLEEYKIEEKVEVVSSRRIPASPESHNDIIGLPGKAAIPISQILSDQINYPRLSGLITIPIEEDDGWELKWEEDSQAFSFYNCFSGKKDLVNIEPSSTSTQEFHASQQSNLPSRKQKQAALEAALHRGHTRVISQLLEYEIDLNQPLRYRKTTLQWATDHGNVELVEFLLAKGANPNVTRGEVDHVLVSAVKKVHPGIVKALLSKSDRVHSTMALNQAVQQQDNAIVKILLENGVCCDFEDSDRPRHQRDMAQSHALSSTPEPDKSMSFIPPLVHAVYRSNTNIARLLLENGADVNSAFHSLLPFYDMRDIKDRRREPRIHIRCGRAIQIAMDQRDQGMVQLLLDFGADINLEPPIWLYHECSLISRSEYLRITAGLMRLRRDRLDTV
jgi:serum/glucocorticoid-regulated kinase 2